MGRSGVPDYRRCAFGAYKSICVHCGFGIEAVLEVAHLDGDATNGAIENLAILCPTCHRMHDLGLIPTEHIVAMRDGERSADWGKLMKDGASKAHETLRRDPESYRRAARKAHETMRQRRHASGAADVGGGADAGSLPE